jgi:hypothetical protein
VPTLVGGSRRFTSVSTTGGANACGLEAQTGRVYCWGRFVGQAGQGASAHGSEPTVVGGSTRFSSIVAAYSSGCGVEEGTGVGYCWSYRDMTPAPIFPPLHQR